MSVNNNSVIHILRNPIWASSLLLSNTHYYFYHSNCGKIEISANFCNKCGQYKKALYIGINALCICWLKLNADAKQYILNLAPNLHLLRNTYPFFLYKS